MAVIEPQWLEKTREAGVRRRAEQLYQQLDMLQQLRRDLKTPLHIRDPMRKALVLMWLFWYLFWMAERFRPKDCVSRGFAFSKDLKDTVRFHGELEELS